MYQAISLYLTDFINAFAFSNISAFFDIFFRHSLEFHFILKKFEKHVYKICIHFNSLEF